MTTPIAYAQNDPAWGRELLGLSRTSTIGGYGCLVASIASLTPKGSKGPLTPKQVNDLGRAGGGFVAGTGIGRLERLANLAGLVAPERLRIRDQDPSSRVDLATMHELIRRSLAGPDDPDGFFVEAGGVIVNVDHTGDATPDHFLALVAHGDDGDYAGLDPAPGRGVVIARALRGFMIRWSASKVKRYTVIGLAPIGGALR